MRLDELYRRLVAELGARNEAVIVLEEASGQRISALSRQLSEPAPDALVLAAEGLAKRRRAGEPLQHVVGHWGFRHLDLLQDGRALVVRPETEQVVEVALRELARRPQPLGPVLDLGTGSGAIALSLASEVDDLVVVATDCSLAALSLAAANRERLAPAVRNRVHLVASDWYGALRAPSGAFSMIVSNPPYVAADEWALLDPVVREYDPRDALVSGPNGLEALLAVLSEARPQLMAGGVVVAEIGASQGDAVRDLAEHAGAGAVRVELDLQGRERVVVAEF